MDAARLRGAGHRSAIGELGGMPGTSTQMPIGPGFTNQGIVVLGAAGGAAYAQRPNEYRRQRWDVTLKMDNGHARASSRSGLRAAAGAGGRLRARLRQQPRARQSVGSRQARRTMSTAALAVTDAPDGRRVLALSGRLDADTIPDRLARRAARAARTPARGRSSSTPAGVDYCDGAGIALLVDLLRQPRTAPVEVANLKPAFDALLRAVRSAGARARPRSRAAAPARDRGDRRAPPPACCATCARRSSSSARRPRRSSSAIRHPSHGPLARRRRRLRARRRRRAADRRADLLPARRDPRVPVGDPDEAVRRGDLRRRPDRPRRCCASWAR